jgi:hypothetical protein
MHYSCQPEAEQPRGDRGEAMLEGHRCMLPGGMLPDEPFAAKGRLTSAANNVCKPAASGCIEHLANTFHHASRCADAPYNLDRRDLIRWP